MKAVVFHDVGDIKLDDVDEPQIQQPTDAIVRLTSSAICGTDFGVAGMALIAGLVTFLFNLIGGYIGGKLGEPS